MRHLRCVPLANVLVEGLRVQEGLDEHATRLYGTEERAARQVFGQHATRKKGPEESADPVVREWQPLYS